MGSDFALSQLSNEKWDSILLQGDINRIYASSDWRKIIVSESGLIKDRSMVVLKSGVPIAALPLIAGHIKNAWIFKALETHVAPVILKDPERCICLIDKYISSIARKEWAIFHRIYVYPPYTFLRYKNKSNFLKHYSLLCYGMMFRKELNGGYDELIKTFT